VATPPPKKTIEKRPAQPKTTAERIAPFKRAYGAARPKTESAGARGAGGRTAGRGPLSPPPEARRERRALSHVGGEVFVDGGTPEEQQVLREALAVNADESEVMSDVHGFHSYPARLHPLTASRLIAGLSQKGARVLDPFCGSGTVVVEARALGREALGSDLNPLAVELSWLKSRGPTEKFVSDLIQTAYHIAEVAEERRLDKAEPHKRYDEEMRSRYPIHILLELDSIMTSIEQLPKNELSRMLRLVVSSTLTKLAFSEGDTTRQKAPRRLPGGFAIQLFADKANELGERLNAFSARVPERTPRAHVTHADARNVEFVEDESIDLIVTSPPYPGVYDYLEHHMHRLRWLGLKESRLAEHEIGAKREYRRLRLDEAAERWQYEIGHVLRDMRRMLTRDGRAVMIIADSVVDRQALYADEQIQKAAEFAGMKITAVASQERPLFLYGAAEAFGNTPRQEHVVILRPGPAPRKPRVGDGTSPRDDRASPQDGGARRAPGSPDRGGPARPDRGPRENRDAPRFGSKPHGAAGSARPTGPRREGSSDRRGPPRKGPGPKDR